MKRLLILLLVLLLLAVPVSAAENLVQDGEDLLTDTDIVRLEEYYSTFYDAYGFTPAVATVGNFGGLTIEEFAGSYYDVMEYPDDGILLMVSLEEGQWYILTNGECHHRISDWDAQRIGEELVPMFQDGSFYAAFLRFPELAAEIFQANEPIWEEDQDYPQEDLRQDHRYFYGDWYGVGACCGGRDGFPDENCENAAWCFGLYSSRQYAADQ